MDLNNIDLNNNLLKLWFGKHKGKLLNEVEEDYLDYILTLNMDKEKRHKIENYLYLKMNHHNTL